MLDNANKGIVNLHQTTYNDDVNITAKLDEVMDKMTQQRGRIAQVLKYVNAAHTRDLENLRARFQKPTEQSVQSVQYDSFPQSPQHPSHETKSPRLSKNYSSDEELPEVF
jgi:hypothetical protein